MTDDAILYDFVIPDDEAIIYLQRVSAELHRALNDTADTTEPEPQLDAALHPIGIEGDVSRNSRLHSAGTLRGDSTETPDPRKV